jgi:hypothetical protein
LYVRSGLWQIQPNLSQPFQVPPAKQPFLPDLQAITPLGALFYAEAFDKEEQPRTFFVPSECEVQE